MSIVKDPSGLRLDKDTLHRAKRSRAGVATNPNPSKRAEMAVASLGGSPGNRTILVHYV